MFINVVYEYVLKQTTFFFLQNDLSLNAQKKALSPILLKRFFKMLTEMSKMYFDIFRDIYLAKRVPYS